MTALRSSWQFYAWMFLIVLLLAGTPAWLWLLRGPRMLAAPATLYCGWIIASAALVLMAVLLRAAPADATHLHRRRSALLILGGALWLNLWCLALTWPSLSDDVVRYRLDGRAWLHGANGYALTPEQWNTTESADGIDRLAPHPTTHTIYLPTSQAYFTAVAAVDVVVGSSGPRVEAQNPWRASLSSLSWLGRAGVWRVAAAMLALAAGVLCLRLLALRQLSPWWAALLLWHPLTLIETSGNAHQDLLGVSTMLAALAAASRGHGAVAGILTALAIAVKPIAAVPVALLAPRNGRRRIMVATVLISIALFALPIALGGGYWIDAMRRYGQTWEFNGGVFELLKWLIIDGLGFEPDLAKQRIRLMLAAVLAGAMLISVVRSRSRWDAATGLMLASCLLSPVLYPWYLLWPLAMVACGSGRWSLTILVWSATSVLSYSVLHQPQWRVPTMIMLCEYVPVLLTFIGESLWQSRAVRTDNAIRSL